MTPLGFSASACCAERIPALLTGEARYTSDLPIPGALHLAVLRSPYARARIVSVDTSAAAAMPGVTAVFSGADLADAWAGPMPCAWPVTEDMKSPTHYPLAVGQANYVGDGVACVLATSATAARDALDAIDVEYEPLEAVIDLEDALSDRIGSSSTTRSAPTAPTPGISRSRNPRVRSIRPSPTRPTP